MGSIINTYNGSINTRINAHYAKSGSTELGRMYRTLTQKYLDYHLEQNLEVI